MPILCSDLELVSYEHASFLCTAARCRPAADGSELLPFEYDYIDTCPFDGARRLFQGARDGVTYEGKWGLFRAGELEKPCSYDSPDEL